MQYNVKKCNSAMRVAGLAVFIVWRYNKPRVPAARIEHEWMVRPTHAKYKTIYCIR